MATRSTIAVQHPDGKVTQIYAHYDGYPEWNGRLLAIHYSDYNRAKELVSLGSLSVLKPLIYPSSLAAHTFDSPQPNVCIYYGRDRGEDGGFPNNFNSIEQYVQDAAFEEFNYILVDGKWFVDCGEADRVFSLVSEVLKPSYDDDGALAQEYREFQATQEIEVLEDSCKLLPMKNA
jgi:hypothetical protein